MPLALRDRCRLGRNDLELSAYGAEERKFEITNGFCPFTKKKIYI